MPQSNISAWSTKQRTMRPSGLAADPLRQSVPDRSAVVSRSSKATTPKGPSLNEAFETAAEQQSSEHLAKRQRLGDVHQVEQDEPVQQMQEESAQLEQIMQMTRDVGEFAAHRVRMIQRRLCGDHPASIFRYCLFCTSCFIGILKFSQVNLFNFSFISPPSNNQRKNSPLI